ncbi:TonB-dependent receptor [Chitinophaga lutea]|nr:TonB-dependent receptor [Chitinophaga lutea]
MKIAAFFLISACLTASANGFAQKVTLREKNARIEKVLLEIKRQTGYVFFYDAAILKNAKPVTMRVQDADIADVLKRILKYEGLDFAVQNKTITIIKIRAPGYQPPHHAADTFTIKGTITNAEDNTPIPGVSILNRNSGIGTQTNPEGRFTLKVSLDDKLVITHMNYENINYEVKNNDDIFIKLAQKVVTLNTDVVVVGYATQKKTSVVSSVSTVSGEELKFGGRNLSNNLQGQLPGIISFQRSGEPGYDNATFWIRGISTYNGAQNPLILVDGVPRNFNDIDPNEIATFSILKDAAATAVFGAEGANGVILVTTKRGRIQKTEITYRGEYSVLTPLRMPEFVGSAEYLSTYNEALRNEGKAPIIDEQLIEKYRNHADPDLYPDVNWLDMLMRDHTNNMRHNLTFRGGTSKARFFVAGSYYKESGLFKNNALAQYSSNIDLKRYNLRSNIDIDVSPSTLLRVDLSGQYLETNYPGVGAGTIFTSATITPSYLFPAVYSDGKLADHPRSSNNRVNPFNQLNHSGYTNEFRTNIQSRVDLEQKLNMITPGLSAKVSASYDFYGNYNVRSGKSINTYFATGRDANDKLKYTQIKSGTDQLTDAGTSQSSTKNIYLEASLNYTRQFAQKHDVTGMALAYQKESQVSSDRLPFRKMAYVGRLTYAYDRRYSIEVNVGITGSEAFAEGYRYGVFPAAGVAWIASNEPFYPEALRNVLSNMKLRFSYGLTGNDYYGNQRFLYRGGFTSSDIRGATFGYNAGGRLNSYSGLAEDRFSAPHLSWETETKRNYGIELGFFGNKLNINADYFDNNRYDILVQRRSVSAAAGFRQSPFQNFGKVTNKGVEANINFRQSLGQSSMVTFRGNFTYARNKVIEMDELMPLFPWMASTGNRLNMPNIWVAERLFRDSDFDITTVPGGNPVYQLKKDVANQNYFNPDVRPGDIKYKDLNGDGLINQFDQSKYESHPYTPEITYGFGVGYECKGFSINCFFTGIANTSVVLENGEGLLFPYERGMDESNVRTMARDRWREGKGDNQQVLFPRLRSQKFTNNVVPSTWWLRDAGFMRLKNAELGYSIPRKMLNRLRISNARVYLLGYNLLTWDKLKYWDPEQGNGTAGLTYPQSRSFTAGAEFTF